MATMESLIGLVNRIQRACTVLGDHGGGEGGSLWEALPSVAVVGGQVRNLLEKNSPFLLTFHLIFCQRSMLRARGSRRFSRASSAGTSSPVDLV